MIVGQTMLSVRMGAEEQAEAALKGLATHAEQLPGHVAHRVLRSFGMSPLASNLGDDETAGRLRNVHFILETEWDSLEAHNAFYLDSLVKGYYLALEGLLTSGPFEVLYDCIVEEAEPDNVAL